MGKSESNGENERAVHWLGFKDCSKLTDYTCNPEYLDEWNKLVAKQKAFIYDVQKNESSKIQIEGFGGVEVNNLRVSQAFDDC